VLTIDWAGHQWELLPEKALHWPARRTVIVADVHFGKAAAFRHLGVPVPHGTTAHDLARLGEIVQTTRCERMIILGDLLHARHGRAEDTMQSIGEWRRQHAALDITLVRGNHDLHAGDPPVDWMIACVDRLQIDRIHLQHALAEVIPALGGPGIQRAAGGATTSHRSRARRDWMPGLPRAGVTIAGHVHPCVRLRDVDGSSMRAACFVFSDCAALLPAFGSFTGTHAVQPREGDRVFAVGAGEVIEIEGVCA
jgi:uncharacterized protein